jgi:hypothetical protein
VRLKPCSLALPFIHKADSSQIAPVSRVMPDFIIQYMGKVVFDKYQRKNTRCHKNSLLDKNENEPIQYPTTYYKRLFLIKNNPDFLPFYHI